MTGEHELRYCDSEQRQFAYRCEHNNEK